MEYYVRRPTVHARNAMVATSEIQAAMAGIKTLIEGGNAADAAIAISAALCVTEPMSTGIGGDMFALYWSAQERKVYALNSSGRAPKGASLEELKRKGLTEISETSPYAITVPGLVSGWDALLKAHGSMPLSRLLEPAIRYAEIGFSVPDTIANLWESNQAKLARYSSGHELLKNGRAPKLGEVMRLPELSKTLRALVEGGTEALYQGDLAEKICSYVLGRGGWLTTSDLKDHYPTWEEPICTEYKGVTCWQCPPNGQGISVLLVLNIMGGFNVGEFGFQSVKTYHHLIEAIKLSFADALHYIADPNKVTVPSSQLVSKRYAAMRRPLIEPEKALSHLTPGVLKMGSDTAYISVVDQKGNACSFINSLFEAFGTGLVVPGTGIVLHNRGSLFSLDPEHPNKLEPGKRPYHTIIPGLATRGGHLWLSYGVTGGFMQPQGHLQVLTNMIDFGLEPQAALDALRFCFIKDSTVALEREVPVRTVQGLKRKGHKVVRVGDENRTLLGGGHIVEVHPESGTLRGGSDPRKAGYAIGW